ncbi:MAG: glycosyltransferase family 4 protein [Verrucomicrobiae bacterium]|nr:glycosyltransferase family 4 protein [Verrucomicrobiae bacterium]
MERRTWNHEEKTSRFLFVNQFVPPDPAPTARLLGEVAEELQGRGHEAMLVGDRIDYRGAKTLLGSRALREARSLLRLLGKMLTTPRADVIVCLTSPPMLPWVAYLARIRHRGAKLIHWAMDLYPDVAVALGEVRKESFLHRVTRRLMQQVYRNCQLVIALDREMARRIGSDPVECRIAPPWPPPVSTSKAPSKTTKEEGTFTWLYSGNLGRAHEWRTLLEAQARLEAEGIPAVLVFQGEGTEIPAARRFASTLDLKRCLWRPYANDEELLPSLLEAGALVVTQKPATAGCLWPSKLALALQTGRPILWVGETDGGIAESLQEAGQGVFAPGESASLAENVARLVHHPSSGGDDLPDVVARVKSVRESGIRRVADWCEEVGRLGKW